MKDMPDLPNPQGVCPEHVAKLRAQIARARENGTALRRTHIQKNFDIWCSSREQEAKGNGTLREWCAMPNDEKFALYKEHYKGGNGVLGYDRATKRNESLGI